MSDSFEATPIGDFKKIYESLQGGSVNIRVLLALLTNNYQDTTIEERIQLDYFLDERTHVLREHIPLTRNSHITLVDTDHETLSGLLSLEIHDVGTFVDTSNRQIAEWDPTLSPSRLNVLRRQIKARRVEEKPSIEDSFNKGM